jgi:hypothetical protein
MVRQAGHRTHKNRWPSVMAAPIVGENSIGITWPALIPNSNQVVGVL